MTSRRTAPAPLTVRNDIGIQVISAVDGTKKTIQLPAGARVTNATWSPDSKSIAFYLHGEDATHIWIADVATGASRQVTKAPVLATLVTTFEFSQDGKQIATVLVPEARPAMPQAPAAPTGPSVKLAMETDKNRLRTFASLMSTPYEEQLLEWHSTGQLALVDVAKGTVKKSERRRWCAPRPVAGRQIRPRDADAEAVLLRRARQQLRADRGDLG